MAEEAVGNFRWAPPDKRACLYRGAMPALLSRR